MIYLSAQDLTEKTGFPMWKSQRIIAAANRQIKENGGIVRKGMAPRKLLEKILFCDLSDGKEE